jgi:pyruvate kinase
MKIFATLPAVHRDKQLRTVAEHPLVDALRFNTGMKSHLTPIETLDSYLTAAKGKEFWVDLKGRQLRITQWAVPGFGDIILNHEIEVNLPTEIYFRREEKSIIRKIQKNKIYVDPPPPKAVGAGQAINIPDDSLRIKGYFTEEDLEYIEAASKLGIKNFLLSFVEEEQDILRLTELIPDARIIAKIESRKGMQLIQNSYSNFKIKPMLMAARDDLYINIGEDKTNILPALKLILEKDPSAIVASRLFTSLEEHSEVSLSDLSDFYLMKSLGYNACLLSDGLCSGEKSFLNTMSVLKQIETKKY